MIDRAFVLGAKIDDSLLSVIARDGICSVRQIKRISVGLRKSGLIAIVKSGKDRYATLDSRHPNYALINRVLATMYELSDTPSLQIGLHPREEHCLDLQDPLGFGMKWAFCVLHCLCVSGVRSEKELRRRMPGATSLEVRRTLKHLAERSLVQQEGDSIALRPNLPPCFKRLIAALGQVIVKRSPMSAPLRPVVSRPRSFARADDGAPSIFGSDARLRNLMALAVHGAMYVRDLRAHSGAVIRSECASAAPFGRGGLVTTWNDRGEIAATLNTRHPLYIPLKALLVKIETRFPLPASVVIRRPSQPPACGAWWGDRNATFGGPVVSNILFSMGIDGWTCEAFAVRMCTGHDRVVVKKAIRKLEAEGIITADRERRPGCRIRCLRISEDFCAKAELENLLRAAVAVWPSLSARYDQARDSLPSRTKAHLLKRGLAYTVVVPPPNERHKTIKHSSKQECLRRYLALTASLGRELSSHEVNKRDCNLYRCIRRNWGSFSLFRA